MTRKSSQPPQTAALAVPVSRERVDVCIASARWWADHLPGAADRLQRRADTWALIAGVLGIITGLTIWVTLLETTTWYAQGAATVLAILSGLSALVPRIKSYGERAGRARGLATQYGAITGRLIDLAQVIDDPRAQRAAATLIEQFQVIKAAKDELPGLHLSRPHKG